METTVKKDERSEFEILIATLRQLGYSTTQIEYYQDVDTTRSVTQIQIKIVKH